MNTFTIIGGDFRSVKLANLLQKDGNLVTCYGLDKAQEIMDNSNIKKETNIKNAIEGTDIIIASLPLSKNGEDIVCPFSINNIKINELYGNYKEKTIFAGNISDDIFNNLNISYKQVNDLMKYESLTILNTIATAEGAIDCIIQNTDTIIQGRNILILGFGRVSKTLAYKLKALDCYITCAARKESDIAWIKTYGYNSININSIGENFKEYDIIINTVPHVIVGEEELKQMKDGVFLLDLASKPGGFDTASIDKFSIKYTWALALPGKVAPLTSAQFIKNCIYDVM